MADILPWVDKYRPRLLDDVVGNDKIVGHFKKIVENGNVPHMLLVGKPGVGKTTSVICLAKIMLEEQFQDAFLELNASDDRGINTVRDTIVSFCQKKVTFSKNRQKIIFLDEAESLTKQAQQALKRIIENFSTTTRFILACNDSSGFIDAIQSRCTPYRFECIKNTELCGLLTRICVNEKIKHTQEALLNICLSSDSDARKAVNCLQRIAMTYGEINLENVSEVIGKPNTVIITDLLKNTIAKNFGHCKDVIDDLMMKGYYGLDILRMLFSVIKDYDAKNMSEQMRFGYLGILGDTEVNLNQGADEYIQLLAMISKMSRI